ncbi:MAG: cytochrome c oxidase assembly protein [Actinomycetota bacterium]
MELTLSDIGWQAHPEVWVLVIGLAALAWYVSRVLQPNAIAAGYPPLSRSNTRWFVIAVASLWVASDWPVHDVAEEYLYAVHMFQHLFISMLVPAMFLLAAPNWIFDLLAPEGSAARRVLRLASRPIVAGVVFNALTLFLHWTTLVQLSFENGSFHFAVHLVVFLSGLLMWMPVIGPVAEWRLPPVGQCIYLFMMSIVPTVPGGWLVFAEQVVYRHYDTPERLWGISALTDQQAAGVIMKLVGGFFLWGVILVIFARWAAEEQKRDVAARKERHALTFEQVEKQFAESEAPAEPSR